MLASSPDGGTLIGTDEADVLIGGSGWDIIVGHAGTDQLYTGPSGPTDIIADGLGDDAIYLGARDDWMAVPADRNGSNAIVALTGGKDVVTYVAGGANGSPGNVYISGFGADDQLILENAEPVAIERLVPGWTSIRTSDGGMVHVHHDDGDFAWASWQMQHVEQMDSWGFGPTGLIGVSSAILELRQSAGDPVAMADIELAGVTGLDIQPLTFL